MVKKLVTDGVILFCILAVCFFLYDLSRNEQDQLRAPLFSERDMLQSLWEQYKNEYVEAGTGRTIDKQRDNVTTSEGQSYTMLRSVWMDDKGTFDLAWRWTKDNLRKDSFLFAWKFGERVDGSYGILIEEGGNTSATDGDTDIALALILAYGRWGEEKYLLEAREILEAVWQYEVIMIDDRPYILANDIEKSTDKEELLVNPSYFSPYAYRIFAIIDPVRDWESLVDTSYGIIEDSMKLPLDKEYSIGLPPDWIIINRTSGEINPAPQLHLRTDYGYDAIRTVWRMALDYEWFASMRAQQLLNNGTFLSNEWKMHNKLASVYAHDGVVVYSDESYAMYGTALALFHVIDTDVAHEVYAKKLVRNYNVNTFQWYEDPGYYGDNWAWFGLALYTGNIYNYVDFLMNDSYES